MADSINERINELELSDHFDEAELEILDPEAFYDGFRASDRAGLVRRPPNNDPEHRILIHEINKIWSLHFNAEPYTSFVMVDYLLQNAGISYAELWTSPNTLTKKFTKSTVLGTNWTLPIFYSPGRCTTFALRMEELLCEVPGMDVEFHHTQRHRLGRCKKTGMLIDTNSLGGPFILVEGAEVKRKKGDRPQNFKYLSGTSIYTTENSGGKEYQQKSKGPCTREQAMSKCLLEVAMEKELEPLCYFRFVRSHVLSIKARSNILRSYDLINAENALYNTSYYGMIKWRIQHRDLLLIPDPKDNTPNLITIVWDGSGTAEGEDRCKAVLKDFISQYGGPHGHGQWYTADFVADIHCKFWSAANGLWGYPKVK